VNHRVSCAASDDNKANTLPWYARATGKMMAVGDDGYLLDNRRPEAGTRFGALSELFDPITFGHVTSLGIGPGWRCWEVGAGSPSVPTWLADHVAPGGHVIATDLDVSHVATAGGFEIRRHDVGADPPPGDDFDLVHARLVLVHVPQREDALRAMVGSLRPGGWLLLEDADPALQPLACPHERGPAEELANRIRRGFRQLLAARDAELAYGRTLPHVLRSAGLVDVGADGYFPLTSPACAVLEGATVAQLRAELVSAGLATDAEIDAHLVNVAAGGLDCTTAPMISAWGRRPG